MRMVKFLFLSNRKQLKKCTSIFFLFKFSLCLICWLYPNIICDHVTWTVSNITLKFWLFALIYKCIAVFSHLSKDFLLVFRYGNQISLTNFQLQHHELKHICDTGYLLLWRRTLDVVRSMWHSQSIYLGCLPLICFMVYHIFQN